MSKMAFIGFACLAAAVPTSPTVALGSEPNAVVHVNGSVRDFYGVPLDLTLWGLEKLKYASTLGWKMREGEVYPTARIVVNRKVALEASFASDGDMYMLETSSPGAVGPGRIAVGSTLADVRRTWPSGKLIWGIEDGQYVTFDTGARIYYQFSPKALPPEAWDRPRKDVAIDPGVKVITIRLAALDREP